METNEILYYIAAFAIGTAAGFPKAIIDFRSSTLGNLVARGVLSGFLCFGIVAVATWQWGGDDISHAGFLGIGALVIVLGEQAQKFLWKWAAKQFGIKENGNSDKSET